jgi:translation initiation factor 6 (eIF-6)
VNPLIVEHINTNATGWKLTVSKMFKNKKKKALSNAIIKNGYDAIITIDSEAKEIKEIVSLKGVKLYD